MVQQISGLMNQSVPLRTVFSKDMVQQISGLMNQLVPLRTVFSSTNQLFDESISAFKNSV